MKSKPNYVDVTDEINAELVVTNLNGPRVIIKK